MPAPPAHLLMASAAVLLALGTLPSSSSIGGSHHDSFCEQARIATQAFNKAEQARQENADVLLEKGIGLWEACLERDPDNAEAHSQAGYLLSRVIGRAWERGEQTDSKKLQPVWARVAFHRERVLELTAGQAYQPMSAMEVACAYQQAGDFLQAERFYRRVADPLVLFRFYAEEERYAQAENVFRSLSGFRPRYDAATYLLRGARRAGWDFAIRCGELMLAEESEPHRRAAVYCILAHANAWLQRWDAVLETARNAVQLNPKHPWGWHWLAEAYCRDPSGARWPASAKAVLEHQLTFFTDSTEIHRRSRGQIYGRLGSLHRLSFRQYEKAICCYRKEIAEFTGLPGGEYRCGGAYMNIIATLVENLHDPARAKRVVDEASRASPSYFEYAVVQQDLRRFGLVDGGEAAP